MKRYSLDKNAPGMFEHATGGWVKVKDVREWLQSLPVDVAAEHIRTMLATDLKNHHEAAHRTVSPG